MKKRTFLSLGLALCACGMAWADTYPSQEITIVVPFPAGGGVDLLARAVSQNMSAFLGKSVLVDNRAGATGIIGTGFAARAAPDGYTLVIGTPGPMSIAAAAGRKLPYDPFKDLAPISGGVTLTPMLVVGPASPFRSVKDLVAQGRTASRELTYASGGVGNSQHLAGEMFKQAAGIKALHVAYKGTAPALTDIMGGQVDFFFSDPSALPLIQSGKLRAIAVSTPRRSAVLPDVPTVAESGLPGFTYFNWYAFLAPAKTPRPVIDRLNKAIVHALNAPDVRERLLAAGMEPAPSSPEELQAFIRKDYEQWKRTIVAGNIKLEE